MNSKATSGKSTNEGKLGGNSRESEQSSARLEWLAEGGGRGRLSMLLSNHRQSTLSASPESYRPIEKDEVVQLDHIVVDMSFVQRGF